MTEAVSAADWTPALCRSKALTVKHLRFDSRQSSAGVCLLRSLSHSSGSITSIKPLIKQIGGWLVNERRSSGELLIRAAISVCQEQRMRRRHSLRDYYSGRQPRQRRHHRRSERKQTNAGFWSDTQGTRPESSSDSLSTVYSHIITFQGFTNWTDHLLSQHTSVSLDVTPEQLAWTWRLSSAPEPLSLVSTLQTELYSPSCPSGAAGDQNRPEQTEDRIIDLSQIDLSHKFYNIMRKIY